MDLPVYSLTLGCLSATCSACQTQTRDSCTDLHILHGYDITNELILLWNPSYSSKNMLLGHHKPPKDGKPMGGGSHVSLCRFVCFSKPLFHHCFTTDRQYWFPLVDGKVDPMIPQHITISSPAISSTVTLHFGPPESGRYPQLLPRHRCVLIKQHELWQL